MPGCNKTPAWARGKRWLAMRNVPQRTPDRLRIHPDSNGDAQQRPTPTTRSGAAKATRCVSRADAWYPKSFSRIYNESQEGANDCKGTGCRRQKKGSNISSELFHKPVSGTYQSQGHCRIPEGLRGLY